MQLKRLIRLIALVGVIVVSIPSSVSANYARFFHQGQRLQKQGQHQQAIKMFDLALKHDSRPGAQYFKAISLIALKRYQAARELLLIVQRNPRTPPLAKRLIPGRLSEIASALARLPGLLHILTAGLTGATVLLDGKPVGLTPLKRKQKAGSYQLVIKLKGYKPHIENLSLRPGKTLARTVKLTLLPVTLQINVPGVVGARVSLNGKHVGTAPLSLKRKPGNYRLRVEKEGYKQHDEALVLETAVPLTRTIQLQQLQLTKTPRRDPPKQGLGKLGLAGYIVGGVGLGLIIGGGVFHGLAVKNRNDSANRNLQLSDATSKYNTSNTQIKTAYALYGIGGAALITGIVLLILEYTADSPKDSASDTQFLLLPQPRGASVLIRY